MSGAKADCRNLDKGNNCLLLDELIARVLKGLAASWPVDDSTGANAAAVIARIRYHGVAFLLSCNLELLADWPGEITRTIQAVARLHGIWESSHKRAVAAAIDAPFGKRHRQRYQ